LPSKHLRDAFERIAAISETHKLPETVVSATFQTPIAYQNFTYHQLKKAEKDTDEIRQRRLLITDLAGDLMESSHARGIAMTMAMSGEETGIADRDEESEQENSKRGVATTNPFSSLNQHIAYLYNPNIPAEDIQSVVMDSSPAQIIMLGCNIIDLVCSINDFALGKSNDHIFKPTNKSMRSAYIIPTKISNDEQCFKEVVDHLYFLLYEGSGCAKRITNLLTDDELDPLWNVKYLRLEFRHDVEHGKDKEIMEKQEKISLAYRTLIGKSRPKIPSEWKMSQFALYQRIVEMLILLREKQG